MDVPDPPEDARHIARRRQEPASQEVVNIQSNISPFSFQLLTPLVNGAVARNIVMADRPRVLPGIAEQNVEESKNPNSSQRLMESAESSFTLEHQLEIQNSISAYPKLFKHISGKLSKFKKEGRILKSNKILRKHDQ